MLFPSCPRERTNTFPAGAPKPQAGQADFPVRKSTQATTPGSEPSVEKLSGETIVGVYAEGRRITHVIPAGAQGNNRDITIVTETWFSPDLKIEVLAKITVPRTGETTRQIRDLTRDELKPELFQIPEDYKIQSPQQN